MIADPFYISLKASSVDNIGQLGIYDIPFSETDSHKRFWMSSRSGLLPLPLAITTKTG